MSVVRSQKELYSQVRSKVFENDKRLGIDGRETALRPEFEVFLG